MALHTQLLLATTLLASAGCHTNFGETHYFRSRPADANGDPSAANYYRITVRGDTLISSSRYLSAYFDPSAVDLYFNEIKQPPDAAIVPRTDETRKPSDEKAESATETAKSLSPTLDNKDLVLILSTNSEDIANQIGALAANQQFAASLGGLLARSDFAATADAEAQSGLNRQSMLDTLNFGKNALPADAVPAKADVDARMLQLLNRLAFDLDYAGPFKDLAAAKDWFAQHRSRLLDRRQP